jgi:hypothetical protein
MLAIGDWELTFRALVKAVMFPVVIVNGLGYIWVGGIYDFAFVTLLLTFVIAIEHRQGMRAAVLIWVLMLFS